MILYGWSTISSVYHVIEGPWRGWQRLDHCGERWVDEWSTKRPSYLNPCSCVLYAERMAEYQADLEARRERLNIRRTLRRDVKERLALQRKSA